MKTVLIVGSTGAEFRKVVGRRLKVLDYAVVFAACPPENVTPSDIMAAMPEETDYRRRRTCPQQPKRSTYRPPVNRKTKPW